MRGELTGDDLRLYEVIWQRTMASQMPDARGSTVTAVESSLSRGVQSSAISSNFHQRIRLQPAEKGAGAPDLGSDWRERQCA